MFSFSFREHSGALFDLTKKVPNSATENDFPSAEKTDSICHTYYRILGAVERFKGSGGGGKGKGHWNLGERKVEDRFFKHLKEMKPILSTYKTQRFKL